MSADPASDRPARGTLNAIWARTFVDELSRAGVREVCLAPGSRSTPLVLAAARHEGLRLRVHLDERSAAFFALGVGKASGRPAAVVTTSGTAAANLFPAVVEAAWSETPLVLLTADRPHHLRGADANQAIDQSGLFGHYVRAFHEVAPPSLDPAAVRHLRALADRSVADALGRPAGPVHLNFPFRKPLEPPADDPEAWAPEAHVPQAFPAGRPERPLVRITPRRTSLDDDELAAVSGRLERATEGVIVAGPGPDPEALGRAVVGLGARTGFPVLADPLSGARWRTHHGAVVLGAYDLFLGDPEVRRSLRPDLIVRVGRSPTSANLARWLEDHRDVRQVVIDDGHRWKDHALTARTYLRADAVLTLNALAERSRRHASADWREGWKAVEQATRDAVADADAFRDGHEGAVAAEVVARLSGERVLFVSGSMPVRDLDAFGEPGQRDAPLVALGNRGASGIDGIVSTALGVAAGAERPVVAVLGDLAFHHDLTGLLATREEELEVLFVVVHNDGGGIFHRLPVREHEPHFTRYFATPHGLDFRHAAELYGLPYRRVDDAAELSRALAAELGETGCRILEVRTVREDDQIRRRAVRDAVRSAVASALER